MRKQTISLFAACAVTMTMVSGPAFAAGEPKSNQFWWPDSLSLSPLRDNGVESDPLRGEFNY
ncbi:MAG: hypothetical protein OEY82_06935, partial [Gammaproteobacteria bacterium]|nr:hypothetical protein [Gammaproteobacteria bacterium]